MRAVMVKPFLVLLVLGLSLQAKQKPIVWRPARVVSQEIGTTREGAVESRYYNVRVARKLNIPHNNIVLETPTDILTLREIFAKDHYLVLEINGSTSFYLDKNDWYIMVDSRHRAHRFSLTGMTRK